VQVTELLKDNLYEYSRYIRHSGSEPYFTLPRLKHIMRQLLEAVAYIHSLNLIHCDIKPENILIQSYSQVLTLLLFHTVAIFVVLTCMNCME
jgi:serine/threonine protein kinase